MKSESRSGSACVLVLGLLFMACSAPPDGALTPLDDDEEGDLNAHPRDARTPDTVVADAAVLDAAVPDAAVPDAAVPDAAVPDASVPPDAAPDPDDGEPNPLGGIVSCFSDFNPGATCAVPNTHCCFTNYNAQHAGSCETASCGWGTIDCDGPEDCASGQRCCAHVIIDPQDGITGYRLSCQATACGAAPAHRELCHPGASVSGTCGRGSSCVSAAESAFDLPRTLSVCE